MGYLVNKRINRVLKKIKIGMKELGKDAASMIIQKEKGE